MENIWNAACLIRTFDTHPATIYHRVFIYHRRHPYHREPPTPGSGGGVLPNDHESPGSRPVHRHWR